MPAGKNINRASRRAAAAVRAGCKRISATASAIRQCDALGQQRRPGSGGGTPSAAAIFQTQLRRVDRRVGDRPSGDGGSSDAAATVVVRVRRIEQRRMATKQKPFRGFSCTTKQLITSACFLYMTCLRALDRILHFDLLSVVACLVWCRMPCSSTGFEFNFFGPFLSP